MASWSWATREATFSKLTPAAAASPWNASLVARTERPATAGALAAAFEDAVTHVGEHQSERTAYFIQPLPPSAT